MSVSTSQVPTIALRGDVEIPQLGFGVFQVPPEDTAEVATRALLAGYRHLDTAAVYRNEAGGQPGRAARDFHLSEAEMAAIEALDAGERTGPDPDVFVRPPG